MKHHLREADFLILESNHDLDMLKVGPYPWYIKQRVMSRTGHLSNTVVSEFLADAEVFDARARHLVLAHLSEQNNTPDIARISAEEALGRRPVGILLSAARCTSPPSASPSAPSSCNRPAFALFLNVAACNRRASCSRCLSGMMGQGVSPPSA